MRLEDLFDPAGLDWAVERGLVTAQTSRVAPGLRVLNYTHRCQYDREWNEVTTQCRGLIATLGGEVVARPWPKFFNAGEHDGERLAALDPDEPAECYDKLDGSLGILYPDSLDGGHRVATRGSFASDQALHATAVWKQRYQGEVPVVAGYTYLFEIVYPANRVVVDYAGADDLFLLGVLDTETHEDLTERAYWPGPRAERLGTLTLRRALELPPRPNAEGVVLKYRRPWGTMNVKVKQEDYVELHRIVTGLSARRVWEAAFAARAGGGEPEDAVRDLARGLPDEFAAFVWETYRSLRLDVDSLLAQAAFLHGNLMRQVDEGYRPVFAHDVPDEVHAAERRKLYARLSDGAPARPLLWMLYDGEPGRAETAAWRMARPAGDARPREVVE